MKIFYLCPSGLHIALVAAGIHLGRLETEKPPAVREIIKLVREYRRPAYILGRPVFVGCDKAGHEIFTVGVAAEHIIMKKAINDIFEQVYKIIPGAYLVVDTVSLANCWVRMGSYISLRLHLNDIGEKLCVYGVKKSYGNIVRIVQKVMLDLK